MTRDELRHIREKLLRNRVPQHLSGETLARFVEENGLAAFRPQGHRREPAFPALELLVSPAHAAEVAAEPGERGSQVLHQLLEQQIETNRILELEIWPGERVYSSRELLPFLYATLGDRHPEKDFRQQVKSKRLSTLAGEAYEQLLRHKHGLSRSRLRELLGGERVSDFAVERAVAELSPTLKVLRVGAMDGEPLWQATAHALPEELQQAQSVSKLEAAAALISKYLDWQYVSEPEETATYFGPVLSRTRMAGAFKGLEAARELVAEPLEGRPAVRLAHSPPPAVLLGDYVAPVEDSAPAER